VGQLQTGGVGELADRVVPVGQQLQDPDAGGMGQRLEEVRLRIGDRAARGERHQANLRLAKTVKP
jgi:hypothetical protein